MKSILCLSITMAGLAFVRAEPEIPTPPPAGWTDSFETATNQAAKEGKDILVDFTGSDWCVWCRRLRSEVFDQPAFVAGVKDRFVLLEADYPTPKKKKLQSASLRAQNTK